MMKEKKVILGEEAKKELAELINSMPTISFEEAFGKFDNDDDDK